MAVTLTPDDLTATIDRAYALAISNHELPRLWVQRAERLADSPSVGLIAAFGAVLLAKATDARIDPMVLKASAPSDGAFNVRAAATALGARRRALGYDIGSTSDRDPINQNTLISAVRRDEVLGRVRKDHKAFVQLLITWLGDVNDLADGEALEAFASYVRVRSSVVAGRVAPTLAMTRTPTLGELATVLDGFVGANPAGGATGMALTAAAFRAAAFPTQLPGRNDPRRLDVRVLSGDALFIGCEVKQVTTEEAVADTLIADCVDAECSRGMLVVLPPGKLARFDRQSAVGRADDAGVLLRVCVGAHELLCDALFARDSERDDFARAVPALFGEALFEANVSEQARDAWTAISSRWSE